MSKEKDFKTICENFMETFKNDPVLTEMIPDATIELFHDEFGINIYNRWTIPIVFTVGWRKIMEFLQAQPVSEYAAEIFGISIEYRTNISECDKPCNITPQLIHKRIPVFTKQDNQVVSGVSFTDELLAKYNTWRSVNLNETIDKIESDIFAEILNDFGENLFVPAAIFPLMSAIYAVGIEIARRTHQPVNMYNVFEIEVVEDDTILLNPFSFIKQYAKNDSK